MAANVAKVKIFGERNTSTNAMKRMIEMNSGARVLPSVVGDLRPGFQHPVMRFFRNLRGSGYTEKRIEETFENVTPERSWKHCATIFDDVSYFEGCVVLFMVRNPYSWLQALHRRPYHARQAVPESLEEFLTAEWQPTKRDLVGTQSLTPIELYNRKLSSYLQFMRQLDAGAHLHFVVTFEAFAVDQIAAFQEFGFHLKDCVPAPKALERSTKDRSRDKDFYRDYYGNELWKKDISPGARDIINDGIDWTVANRFGYQKWA